MSWIDGTEGNDWIAAPSQSTHKWVLKGNAGDDFIQGTDKNNNWIFGHEGNDYIHGAKDFRDHLNGGSGDEKYLVMAATTSCSEEMAMMKCWAEMAMTGC